MPTKLKYILLKITALCKKLDREDYIEFNLYKLEKQEIMIYCVEVTVVLTSVG